MEIDGTIVKRNWKTSSFIAIAGMAVPFGLGAALSVPLYHTFISSSVKFTNFMLFTGVAYSITAFPVLCRILTELKLLDTNVGIIVLSAGVGNDVVGWVLLALSVALVGAGSGLTALWILLVCVAWALFLFLVVRHVVYWLAVRTGSIDNGPTVFFMTVIFLLMFGSAFFTDIIGVSSSLANPLWSIAEPSFLGASYLRRVHGWSDHPPRRRPLHRADREAGRHGANHILAIGMFFLGAHKFFR